MGRRSSLHEDFVRVKTPMGLQLFEHRFFFKRKITKTDLALEVVIKNLSKLVWGLSVMFSRISLKNFLVVKSLMGTPLDWKFFTHNLFFQFLVWAQGGTHIKNWFTTIEDLLIWFFANKGIFVSQNSYGYTSSFSRIIFRLRDNQSKMCFKLTILGPAANAFSDRFSLNSYLIWSKLVKESTWCFEAYNWRSFFL